MGPDGGPHDNEPPSLSPDEFSSYESDWNQEFLAGWIDGFGAAKVAVVAGTRAELRRFGLSVDSDGVVDGNDSGLVGIEEAPLRDNPEGHPAYDQGWDQGYDEGHREIIRRIRIQLGARDLFVSNSAFVTTAEVVSELVDYCRRQGAPLLGATPLTDDAIHAFIDGVEPVELPASFEDPASFDSCDVGRTERSAVSPAEGATARPTRFKDRVAGAWKMARRHVDRRTAIVALTSVLATGAAHWFFGGRSVPSRPSTSVQAQPGIEDAYSRPTHWDTYPAVLRDWYLSWDVMVFQLENSGQRSLVESHIASVMVLPPASDELKCMVAGFITDSQRTHYLPQLLLGMNPATTGVHARRMIMGAVDQSLARSGNASIPGVVRPGLIQYQGTGVENDAQVNVMISRAIAEMVSGN